jgi:hypothetical protein
MIEDVPISAEEIVRFVTANGPGTSFVELMHHFGEAARGDFAMGFGPPNIYVWAGMSEEFVDAFTAARPRLEFKPAHFLVYLIDGQMPTWPIARRAPKNGYKKPHWIPVVMELGRE